MIEKMASKWLSLATTAMDGGSAGFAGATNRPAPILGQAPRSLSENSDIGKGTPPGIHGPISQLILDTHQLVVFCHAIRT